MSASFTRRGHRCSLEVDGRLNYSNPSPFIYEETDEYSAIKPANPRNIILFSYCVVLLTASGMSAVIIKLNALGHPYIVASFVSVWCMIMGVIFNLIYLIEPRRGDWLRWRYSDKAIELVRNKVVLGINDVLRFQVISGFQPELERSFISELHLVCVGEPASSYAIVGSSSKELLDSLADSLNQRLVREKREK